MKKFWEYRYELVIALIGSLLCMQLLLPPFLSEGGHLCLLLLFFITIILYRLNAIHEDLHDKGGYL